MPTSPSTKITKVKTLTCQLNQLTVGVLDQFISDIPLETPVRVTQIRGHQLDPEEIKFEVDL